MSDLIRLALIEAGVENLRAFGYVKVGANNIVTDQVYSAFFLKMLEAPENRRREDVRAAADKLIKEIKHHERQRAENLSRGRGSRPRSSKQSRRESNQAERKRRFTGRSGPSRGYPGDASNKARGRVRDSEIE